MNRIDLNALARSLGVDDASDLATKAEVIAAIEEARG